MFERFTDQSRNVLWLANEAAAELDHDYIGTEHLLLGLARLDGAHAQQALAQMSITADDILMKVEEVVGRGTTKVHSRPLSIHGKKSLELALREALQLGVNQVNTEHVLLGILRVDGRAAQIIAAFGATGNQVAARAQAVVHTFAVGVAKDGITLE